MVKSHKLWEMYAHITYRILVTGLGDERFQDYYRI